MKLGVVGFSACLGLVLASNIASADIFSGWLQGDPCSVRVDPGYDTDSDHVLLFGTATVSSVLEQNGSYGVEITQIPGCPISFVGCDNEADAERLDSQITDLVRGISQPEHMAGLKMSGCKVVTQP